MLKLRITIIVISLALGLSASAIGQEPAKVEFIIAEAAKRSTEYIEAFRNLLAVETKTFEVFDKSGAVKKRRSVTSNFIAYQLSKSDGEIVEYRHVIAVDGRPLENAEARAQDFFEKIVDSESSAKELERIRKESLRFDDEIQINGLTLYQAVPLQPSVRDSLEIGLDRIEAYAGRRVYIISYRQKEPSPAIRVNQNDNVMRSRAALDYELGISSKKPLNARIRGTFWIDTETFQIWREVRELTVRPDEFVDDVVAERTEFTYRSSEFSVLTPSSIVHTSYRIDRKSRSSVKDVTATFEYSKFTKPDVEVRSADVK